ncbi:ABC transporter transmembrane domain-containing protein [Streptomyces indonesiensis]
MSGAPGASGRRPSRLWPYLAPHRGALLAVMGLSLVSSAAALAQPLLVQRTLGAASGGSGLGTALALLVGVVVAAAALEGVQRYLLQRTAEGVVLMARRTLVETLLRLPVGEFDRRRTGDLISRVGADTTLLRSVVTGGLVDLGSGVVVALGAVVLMASIDPPLLVVTLLSVGARRRRGHGLAPGPAPERPGPAGRGRHDGLRRASADRGAHHPCRPRGGA